MTRGETEYRFTIITPYPLNNDWDWSLGQQTGRLIAPWLIVRVKLVTKFRVKLDNGDGRTVSLIRYIKGSETGWQAHVMRSLDQCGSGRNLLSWPGVLTLASQWQDHVCSLIHRLKLNATGADYGLAPNGYMPPPGLMTMRLLELLSTLTRLPLDKNGCHFANDIFKSI